MSKNLLLKKRPIWLFFLFLLFTSLSEARLCHEVFYKPAPFSGPRLELQEGEITYAGTVLRSGQSNRDPNFHAGRDGNYPLLINNRGEVVISHRLPDQLVDTSRQNFLATHRSLYNTLIRDGLNTEIIFAGHINVIGNRSHLLVDQSSTFHNRVADLGPGKADADLISANGLRLAHAMVLLGNLRLIDNQTQIINFWKQFHKMHEGDRRVGHATDRAMARFELKCFASSKCWADYQRLQSVLNRVVELGGQSYLSRALTEGPRLRQFSEIWFLEGQLMGQMVAEGVISVMSLPQNYSFKRESSPINEMLNRIDGFEAFIFE